MYGNYNCSTELKSHHQLQVKKMDKKDNEYLLWKD